MFLRISSLILLCLILRTDDLRSQLSAGVIEITGRIIERGLEGDLPTEDLRLYVMDYGEVDIDQNGRFEFIVDKDIDIKVEIIPTDFKIMRPLDGLLEGEASSYRIDIYIIHASQDSLLRQQVSVLDEEIKSLKEAKLLTDRQIQQLDQTILDTVFHFQKQQRWFNNRIHKLQSSLEKSAAENAGLQDTIAAYSNQLQNLHDSVTLLIGRLAEALEEQYLRQKEHYDQFSQLLLKYQTRVKDLRDQLPQLEYCFKRPEALTQFNTLCMEYGEARNALNDHHEEHLAGIKHYWENEEAFHKAQQVVNTILTDIHDALILPGVNQQIMPHLKDYASRGIRKVKVVKKAGEDIHRNLDPYIVKMDTELEDLFTQLQTEL